MPQEVASYKYLTKNQQKKIVSTLFLDKLQIKINYYFGLMSKYFLFENMMNYSSNKFDSQSADQIYITNEQDQDTVFSKDLQTPNPSYRHPRTASFANSDDIISTTTIQPNKTIDIITIDSLENGKQIIDSEVKLDIHLFQNQIKHLIGRVTFQMNREKIVSPNSSEFYKKPIQGENSMDGFIQYKFISIKTTDINEDTFNQSRNHKNQIEIQEKSLQISQQYKRLLSLVTEKDNVIKNMQDQMHKLMEQTKKLSINLKDQQTNKQVQRGPISLSINMKPSNKIQTQRKRIIKDNFLLRESKERLQKQKVIFIQQINLLNKTILQLQRQIGSTIKISDDLKQKKAGVQQMKKSFYTNQQKKNAQKQKLPDLPQYSEINEKKAIEEEVFKLQIKTANKIEEIHVEKDALLDRLKNSIVEVDALKSQIENLHVNIRKLSDELKILRKNNSSQGIMAKIQAIRNQNEKMIEDLKRNGSISADEQIFAIRKQNLLIDIELLKKQKQDLRNQLQIEQKQYASKLRQQQTKYYEARAKEIALTKERDTCKMQLDEAKRSLQKFLNLDIEHQLIGATTEELSKQLTSTARQKEILDRNLNNQKIAFEDLSKKCEKLSQQNNIYIEDLRKLRKVQSNNVSLTQKLLKTQAQLKRFDKKYGQLRASVLAIQSAFQNRRKFDTQQSYQKDVIDKLQSFELKIKESQKQLIANQIQNLNLERQAILQRYYDDLKVALQKIDFDSTLADDQKKILKKAKQNELSVQKDAKISGLQQKMNELNIQKQKVQTEFLLQPMNMSQRVQRLEGKFKANNQKMQMVQSQNQKVKQSFALMKDSFQLKSSQQPSNQLRESMSRIQNSRIVSGVQQNNETRKRLMQEFLKAKDEYNTAQQRYFTQIRSLKEKNASLSTSMQKQRLQHENQRRRLQFEYKQKERQFQLQKIQKEGVQLIKSKKMQNMQADLSKYINENSELLKNISIFEQQLKKVSFQCDKRGQQIINLNKQLKNYKEYIEQSNQGMDIMMKTIEQLKASEAKKVNDLQKLMEERSMMFVKIQKIKDNEIAQLQKLVKEIQDKLELETYQGIKLKQFNNSLKEELEVVIKERTSIQQEIKIEKENYKKDCSDYIEQIKMLQESNIDLEKNLLAFAEQSSKLQQQLIKNQIQKQSWQKQRALYIDLEARIKQVQNTKKGEKQQLSYVIQNKTDQLRKCQTELLILQEKFKMFAEQNHNIRSECVKYQVQVESIREKINQKNLQIIQISQQKSLANIQIVRKNNEIEDLNKKIVEYQKKYQILNEQFQAAMEQSNLQRQSPRNQLKKTDSFHSSRMRQPNREQHLTESNRKSFPQIPSLKQEPAQMEVSQIHNVQSLHELNRKHEENSGKKISESKNSIQQVYQTKSQRSARSNISRKSLNSSRKDQLFYGHETPSMKEDHLKGDRQHQLLQQLNERQMQRESLLNQIDQLKHEIMRLKNPQQKKQSQNIKIYDEQSVKQIHDISATFSLGNKGGFLDSRELNNTNQNSIKESKDTKEYQLILQQMERQKLQLNGQLQEEKSNIERLMKEFQQTLSQKNGQIAYLQQICKQYEQRRKQFDQVKNEYEQKIEDIIQEMIQKQNNFTKTIRELQEDHEKIDKYQQQINSYQIALEQKDRIIQQLSHTIKKLKSQYRKYQQQSQMQILMLRQKFDDTISITQQKRQDLEQLANKYLQLQEYLHDRNNKIDSIQRELEKYVQENMALQQDHVKIVKQREEYAENRRKLGKKMHEMEVQLLGANEKLMESNKSIGMTITKSNIKIENMQEQYNNLRSKFDEKENIIVTLKNEIGLYNEECSELKRQNQELDYQLQKVTQELKDIMVNYQREFQTQEKKKMTILDNMKEFQNTLKEKQHRMSQIRAEMRENEKQRIKAQDQLRQTKQHFQKYKKTKNKQYNDRCSEFQLKRNECQTLKSTNQKLIQNNYLLQIRVEAAQKNYNTIMAQYRQKMSHYQSSLDELMTQVQQLNQRPSKQRWAQISFENQLFKNRINELEQENKKKMQSNDEIIAIQFRKYKARNEIVIRNLEQQMQTYSQKINQLEEGNYYLKKQNESIKGQLLKVSQNKYDLQEQIKMLEEDIEELRQEVEFYKSKRKTELTKLLNDTDD